jgi:hypothetical protein
MSPARAAARVACLAALIAVACAFPLAAEEGQGAPGAEAGPVLFPAQRRSALLALVQGDSDARSRYKELLKAASAALGREPRPIEIIRTEGLLDRDPARIATHESFKDMPRIAALSFAWLVSGDTRYAAKTRDFLVAWAGTNRASGDPIDETNLEPLIVAYDLVAAGLSASERSALGAWLGSVAAAEIAGRKAGSDTGFNNWNSHRLKIVGLIGFVLGRPDLVDYAQRGFREQIQADLRADGSSFDFEERDALHYHCYTLEPLLSLATAARVSGSDWFGYVAPGGASLRKSVDFLLPFVTGEKQHAEYLGSRVKFDRERAASGQPSFRPGRLFEPREARAVLEEMMAFDPSILPVLQKAFGSGSAFPSWASLVAASAR